MKIYGDSRSGNCLKVKHTADLVGAPYEWVETDILQGRSRSMAFLAMNPAGQVPVVLLDDGRALAQSNAIIRFLASNSRLLPEDPYLQAKIDEWLYWEQYSHEPYIAVCRFQMLLQGKAAVERETWRVERGEAALDLMERHLAETRWLVGERFSVADIGLYAYTSCADEGGFDLSERSNIRRWLEDCRAELPQ